jgi:hypothetical protein
MKKAISAATSAALLASLLATAVAPSAFAANPIVVGVGNVPAGGTSAGALSLTFTEQTATSLGNAVLPLTNPSGSFTVTLNQAGVTYSGTPSVVGSTGSLGASASLIAPTVLKISIAGSDTNFVESILVTGLKLSAASGTAPVAITATMGTFTGAISGAGVFSAGTNAQGTLSTGYAANSTSIVVNVVGTTCLFKATGAGIGTLDFATAPESVNVTSASAALGTPGPGQQTLVVAATGNNHQLGESVSQTNTGCPASTILTGLGSVVASISYSSANNATVFPGETNQSGSALSLTEPSAGFLAAASTFTFKILTAGVVFSTAPTVTDNNAAMALSAPVISTDRLSATVTVNAASTVGPATITLAGILYDVASTVTPGTFISVGLTTSAAQAVLPATNTNAVVFRGVLAASATTPIVYIGENNQPAGVVTFTESAAGFFTDGVGTGSNTFQICPTGATYAFTLSPVAVVKGGVAAGNLILRDGSAASTTNIVVGTNLGLGCYGWTIWTASTTASTITIGAAPSATTGAVINVTPDQPAGGVNVALSVGSSNFLTETLAATVQFAIAQFRNQVGVTALSAPFIAPGSTGPAGNVQIAESGLGQLKANEVICFEILWQAGGTPQNTFMNALDTADLPVATASGTGLVISPVTASNLGCGQSETRNPAIPAQYMSSFYFTVLQQSTAGDGKVVVSNLKDTVLTGAALGPVQLSVWGTDDLTNGGTQMDFHSTVVNANIGTAPATAVTTAGSALGATKTGPFSISTKVAKLGKYVTWKFSGGSALVGKSVQIWVATKNSAGKWSAFALLTARTVDASGNAYFWWKTSTKAWISVRGGYLGTLSVATQARWL